MLIKRKTHTNTVLRPQTVTSRKTIAKPNIKCPIKH